MTGSLSSRPAYRVILIVWMTQRHTSPLYFTTLLKKEQAAAGQKCLLMNCELQRTAVGAYYVYMGGGPAISSASRGRWNHQVMGVR